MNRPNSASYAHMDDYFKDLEKYADEMEESFEYIAYQDDVAVEHAVIIRHYLQKASDNIACAVEVLDDTE